MDLKKCLEILELEDATSHKQVKMTYRNLVRLWHPDRFPLGSPLQNEAEQKLRNINIAYEKLTAFLSSEYEINKLARLNQRPDVNRKTVVRQKTARHQTQSPYAKTASNLASGKSPRRPQVRSVPAGPQRTSSAGKYVVFCSLLILTALTVFIIHYLLTLDQDSFNDSAPMSSVLKRLKGESQDSTSIEVSRPGTRNFSNNGTPGKSEYDSGVSGRQTHYCEIYLKGGSVIIADTWWEQEDMIMYQTQFGTLGIEKDTVEKIINR